MNLGAFGVISVLERLDNSGYGAEELQGLWYRRPVLAGVLAFFLLSLAGFPPMAGFAAKYYIFYTALIGGHPELLIIGVLSSVLGIYYYLRPIATMFMQEREEVTGVAGRVPASPLPAIPSTPSGRLAVAGATTGSLRRGGTPSGKLTSATGRSATAVAEKVPATKVMKSPLPSVTDKELNDESVEEQSHNWLTWTGLALSVVGTLVLGVILPFWLSTLQQAAQALLK